MVAEIKVSTAGGAVMAPPSKSMAHRMLICAALSGGSCRVHNIARSEDILATVDCLTALGAEFNFCDNFVDVKGVNADNTAKVISANCRESGSTLRFLIPIMLLSGKQCLLTGSEYLFTRPLTVYEDICKNSNIRFDKSKNGLLLDGQLKSGVYEIAGDISSQFISGLLFALPLLKNDSKIIITGNLESRSYIDLTVSALSLFGVKVNFTTDNVIYISGNQSYKCVDTTVEGDFSNAAFYGAFNALGDSVVINGLDLNSNQGDKVFLKYFNEIRNGVPKLDITNCPDLAPILFTVAAYYNGAVFTGTKRLKMKESDRGAVMKIELAKFGAELIIGDNLITVCNKPLYKPSEILCGHNDHRIVMSLAVLLSRFGGKISGAEAVAKSFPDFFEKISSLGIGVTLSAD